MILYTLQYITGRLWARLPGRYSQARQSAAAAVRDELLRGRSQLCVTVLLLLLLLPTSRLADTTDSNQAKEGLTSPFRAEQSSPGRTTDQGESNWLVKTTERNDGAQCLETEASERSV